MFDEVLDTLVGRVEKLCIGKEGGLRAFMAEGLLHVQQVDPAEMSPGRSPTRSGGPSRTGATMVVIDSLNGYLNAMPEERFLTTHLHEMFSYLNQKGVSTLMVVAQHGMIVGGGFGRGRGRQLPRRHRAAVPLFRDARGEIKQAISVFKKRTGAHERTLREIEDLLARACWSASRCAEFRGVMTGVPQYEGKADMLPDEQRGEPVETPYRVSACWS